MFLQIQKFLLLVVSLAFFISMITFANSSEHYLQYMGTVPYFLIVLLLGIIAGVVMFRGIYIEIRENEDDESSQEQQDEAPP